MNSERAYQRIEIRANAVRRQLKLVPRSSTVIRTEDLVHTVHHGHTDGSSISSMLSASEARNTGFSITAHVRTLCCDFG